MLSGSALKVIVTLAMFVDHTALMLAAPAAQRVLLTMPGRQVTA